MKFLSKTEQISLLIMGVFGFVLVIYTYAGSQGGGLMYVAYVIVIIAALMSSYFWLRVVDQERTIQFFEGETIVYASKSQNTYAVVLSMGDKDVPMEPIKADIYLTNIGILVEPKGTGEVALYIPLDMVSDYSPYQQGMRFRYSDPSAQFIEVLIVVDDRESWLHTLSGIYRVEQR